MNQVHEIILGIVTIWYNENVNIGTVITSLKSAREFGVNLTWKWQLIPGATSPSSVGNSPRNTKRYPSLCG